MRALHPLALVAIVLVLWLVITVRSAATDSPTSTLPEPPYVPPLAGTIGDQSEQELQIAELRRKLKHERRHVRRLRHRQRQLAHVLMRSPSVHEAIGLACVVYGSCTTLQRKARCESGYSPSAHNSSGASGLFQFLLSTWRSTPFGGFSVWSPYANALAAGWMHANGRGGEWTCQ